MLNTLKKLLARPSESDKDPQPPPHDVIPICFQWGNDCLFQKSVPAQMVPRQGDTVTILSQHLSLEGTASNVRWVLMDAPPAWDCLTDEYGPGSYGRGRAKVYLTLTDAHMPTHVQAASLRQDQC